MSEIVFPSGVTRSQRYVQAPDFIPEGTDISDTSNFYSGSKAAVIDIKYNMGDGCVASYMFYNCKNLVSIYGLDPSKIGDASHMFENCKYIEMIGRSLEFNFENTISASDMFAYSGNSSAVTTYAIIPDINLPKCTNTTNMFYYGYIKKIGDINCPLTTNISSMLGVNGSAIESIGLVDFSSVGSSSTGPFGYSTLSKLTYLGGFKNLKASWTSYTFSSCTNLTAESLMNIINYAWDWTDYPDGKVTNPNGSTVSYGTTHKLVLGSTNLAKLTDEQKAVATNKGWTLS